MSDQTITARFYIESTTKHAYRPDARDVRLLAAGRGEQNKAWAEATPSGEWTMHVNNPAAAAFFDENVGRDLDITIRLVDDRTHVSQHSPE